MVKNLRASFPLSVCGVQRSFVLCWNGLCAGSGREFWKSSAGSETLTGAGGDYRSSCMLPTTTTERQHDNPPVY
eukprot:4780434-Amphidinium_carterae.1